MLRRLFKMHWHGLVMMVALAGLAVAAPQVNAAGGPPSKVFVSWPKDRPAPELRLTVGQFTDGSWYLEMQAEGFVFSDLCQTVDGPQTIGHAHVYTGEQKLTTAFVPRVPLGHLVAGRHSYRAMLRAQDHRALVGPDGLIASEIVFTVPNKQG